ncbi:MAG TPA: FMN-binding protein [Streptosporangiaceae bacterium]|nr:FMN-binding protein [Streptosporangiaceae bacterium]
MRRAILAITGTIAGLAALLSFKSHVPSIPTSTAGGTSGVSSSSPASEAGPGAVVPTGNQAGTLPVGESTLTGQVANTVYGPVQIQLIMRDSKIINVSILQMPDGTIHDIQIGQFAFPVLIKETKAAQSAKIDAVSGASYTSAGYIQSLQSALDHGL